MTAACHKLTGPAIALIIASCAGPSAEQAPADPVAAPKAETKPKYKKRPRMNGRGEISSISLEKFFVLQQSDKALIFDARPAFFYNLDHIPGALNMPKTNCDEAIHKRESQIKAALADGKTIVVYCTNRMCPDARTVATHISGFGYPASIFSGGWDSWNKAEMPTE